MIPTNIEPTYNKVLIKMDRDDNSEKKVGSIIIPRTINPESPPPRAGTIVAVGPGRTTENGVNIPCCVGVGDRILLPRYATGVRFEDTDEAKTEYYVIPDVEIICKVKEDK